MSQNFRHRTLLFWAAVTLVAAGALFLAFRGVSWGEMLATIRRARPQYLALACLVATVSYCIRGLRWRALLSAEKPIPHATVFWANMVGYLGNSFLPARAGELVRSALLGKRAGISKSFVLATAVTERIVDVIALVLISLVAALTMRDLPEWLIRATKIMALLAGASLLALFVAARSQAACAAALRRLPLGATVRLRLGNMTEQFLLGARAIHHPYRALLFAGLAVAIWLMDAFSSMISAKALSLTLTLPQALILLTALGLASALPSTPGALGIYQLVAVTILMPFGYSRDAALAYILITQACAYAVISVWGAIGLWRLGVVGGAPPAGRRRDGRGIA